MPKKTILAICASLSLSGFAANLAAEPVCHKCEVIREENKHKVNKYQYYEDYLQDNPDEAKVQKEQPLEKPAPAKIKPMIMQKPAPQQPQN